MISSQNQKITSMHNEDDNKNKKITMAF